MSQAPSRPEAEFKAGAISAAIWRNEAARDDGRPVVRFSIRIQKRIYDDHAHGWKNTDYFFPEELPKVQLIAAKAYEYTMLKEKDNADDSPATEA